MLILSQACSSLNSNPYPELKEGDVLVGLNMAYTTDFLLCFTNLGNYMYIPIYELEENKWKDKGSHINSLITMNSNEKIISVLVCDKLRNDLYTILLTKKSPVRPTPRQPGRGTGKVVKILFIET